MTAGALLIEVRFVGGRYHGRNDWPPSPFRLFQALVAGAYGGRWVSEPENEKDAAFIWLEGLDAPHIAVPPREKGASASYFVPNNDLDAVGGDPHRVSEIRVKKTVATSLFRHRTPVLYAWPFDDGAIHAATITKLAERLHTLGLGRDAAYAQAETASWDEAEARLLAHGGRVVRPGGAAPRGSTCPTKGSLESLKQRHRDGARRFFVEGKAILFVNAAKPRFRQVAYDSPPQRLLFDLVGDRAPWPLDRIVELTERVRDSAAEKLERRAE